MNMFRVFIVPILAVNALYAVDPRPRPAQSPVKAQEPQHLQGIAEAEGIIRAIDETARSVWFMDSSDRVYQVRFTRDTQIVDKDNVYLGFSDLKKDDKIHVYYNTRDMSARQIDVLTKGALIVK